MLLKFISLSSGDFVVQIPSYRVIVETTKNPLLFTKKKLGLEVVLPTSCLLQHKSVVQGGVGRGCVLWGI